MNNSILESLILEIKDVISKYKKEKVIIIRYYEIGKLIVNNQEKFSSKKELLIELSQELGKGYGIASLSDMRRLYDVYKNYPEQFELAKKIGWSHNKKLLKDGIKSELRNNLLKFVIDNDVSAKKLENELIKRRGENKIKEEGFKINIKSIEIKNFKSVVDIKIEKPNPFTVFVGSNACGKSNIFSAIDMLFDSYYNSAKKSFDEFGGKNIFNFSHKNEDIEISLNTGLKEKLAFFNNTLKKEIYIKSLKEPYNKKLTTSYSYLHIKENNKTSKSLILEKDGRNYINVLKKTFEDINAKKTFINILKDVVPDIDEINIIKNKIDGADELFIKDKYYKDEKIPDTLISDGTKNTIILLTAILQSKESQFIFIEEPENGLHPIILEPFIDFIRNICQRRGHYIWFTTHSPTIVRHLERQELIIVNKIKGLTKIKKASDKKFDDYFTDENFKLDDAWLTDIFEGGLPWS